MAKSGSTNSWVLTAQDCNLKVMKKSGARLQKLPYKLFSSPIIKINLSIHKLVKKREVATVFHCYHFKGELVLQASVQ